MQDVTGSALLRRVAAMRGLWGSDRCRSAHSRLSCVAGDAQQSCTAFDWLSRGLSVWNVIPILLRFGVVVEAEVVYSERRAEAQRTARQTRHSKNRCSSARFRELNIDTHSSRSILDSNVSREYGGWAGRRKEKAQLQTAVPALSAVRRRGQPTGPQRHSSQHCTVRLCAAPRPQFQGSREAPPQPGTTSPMHHTLLPLHELLAASLSRPSPSPTSLTPPGFVAAAEIATPPLPSLPSDLPSAMSVTSVSSAPMPTSSSLSIWGVLGLSMMATAASVTYLAYKSAAKQSAGQLPRVAHRTRTHPHTHTHTHTARLSLSHWPLLPRR